MGKRRVIGLCIGIAHWTTIEAPLCSSATVIALRQRLNETVEQLDSLQKRFAEQEVKHARLERDLTVAKSDRE